MPRLAAGILVGWLGALYALAERIIRRWKYLARLHRERHPQQCAVLPPDAYKRPDPLIYSQEYLLAQGLSVTWDNPDIQLFLGGVPVSSSELLADTDYEIAARIWNGSTEAPAVNLAVDFSFLAFGIGTEPGMVGRAFIDLPVRGAPDHPATAVMPWRTPAVPGHYCLVVDLLWPDDANPANNRGQENTNVGKLNSPRATFTFPLRNARAAPRSIRLEVDSYQLAAPPPCEDGTPAAGTGLTDVERAEHTALAKRRAGRGGFPVPAGWTVTIDPPLVQLAAGATQDITVDVLAPDGFVGRQPFNVNALAGDTLVGGVTLWVEGS